MKSLRLKIILVTVAFQFVMLAILLLSNRFFVEPYFVRSTNQGMARAFDRYRQSPGDLKQIGAVSGYKLSVTDARGTVSDSSSPEFKAGTTLYLPKEQLEYFLAHRSELDEGKVLTGVIDREPKGQSVIQLIAATNDGHFIVITQPLLQVRTNVHIAEGFFLGAGIYLLLLTALGTYAISWRFVKPILELTRVAGHIANLDFSQVWRGKSLDETGRLGQSINTIAVQMDKALSGLTRANLELGERMQGQKRFLANISHELRTPLGLIRGYAEILEGNLAESAEERSRDIRIILSETDRLARLIDDIIDLERLGNASFSLERKTVYPARILSLLKERFAPALERRHLRLELDADEEITIDADELRIAEVFDNLVSNAIRHAEPETSIEIAVRRNDRAIEATVFNRGARIPENQLHRVFEPFWRAETDRNRATGGTGLGLSIIREIMKLHGGTCALENRENGVCCTLSFPH